jgi:hypothetical protein
VLPLVQRSVQAVLAVAGCEGLMPAGPTARAVALLLRAASGEPLLHPQIAELQSQAHTHKALLLPSAVQTLTTIKLAQRWQCISSLPAATAVSRCCYGSKASGWNFSISDWIANYLPRYDLPAPSVGHLCCCVALQLLMLRCCSCLSDRATRRVRESCLRC